MSMLYDELKKMVEEIGVKEDLTEELIIKITKEICNKVKKQENTINEHTIENVIEKAMNEGKQKLVKNISKVYEYKVMFDDSLGSMCAVMNILGGRINVFFNKMDIHIVKDTLEIELSKDQEPVGTLVITTDNEVNFDKEDWVLEVA